MVKPSEYSEETAGDPLTRWLPAFMDADNLRHFRKANGHASLQGVGGHRRPWTLATTGESQGRFKPLE
ncbi:hypothetical protein EVAR_5551_1 [Eumeta japonica]|uniref:Uncharacterized protein n=1 Tax=Eumeta variegata TaxID=151549 RepID=A0A4C1U1A2_EUMVA|nr:hypothetical protein EVAR_5551_1 [Eumeta japonica]